MIKIAKIKNLNKNNTSAKYLDHLTQGDYRNNDELVLGRWVGSLSMHLDINNITIAQNDSHFLKMWQQHYISEDKKKYCKSTIKAYDVVFSANKSISILAVTFEQKQIISAHQTAVSNTISIMENMLKNQRGKPGHKVVFGVFIHEFSRELDPQLHSHVFMPNLCYNVASNCYSSLNASVIYNNIAFLRNVYNNELASEVTKLGYSILKQHNGKFEITGFNQQLINKYSIRTRRIESKLNFLKTNNTISYDKLITQARSKTRPAMFNSDRKSILSNQRHLLSPFEKKEIDNIISKANCRTVTDPHVLSEPNFNIINTKGIVHIRDIMNSLIKDNIGRLSHDLLYKKLHQFIIQKKIKVLNEICYTRQAQHEIKSIVQQLNNQRKYLFSKNNVSTKNTLTEVIEKSRNKNIFLHINYDRVSQIKQLLRVGYQDKLIEELGMSPDHSYIMIEPGDLNIFQFSNVLRNIPSTSRSIILLHDKSPEYIKVLNKLNIASPIKISMKPNKKLVQGVIGVKNIKRFIATVLSDKNKYNSSVILAENKHMKDLATLSIRDELVSSKVIREAKDISFNLPVTPSYYNLEKWKKLTCKNLNTGVYSKIEKSSLRKKNIIKIDRKELSFLDFKKEYKTYEPTRINVGIGDLLNVNNSGTSISVGSIGDSFFMSSNGLRYDFQNNSFDYNYIEIVENKNYNAELIVYLCRNFNKNRKEELKKFKSQKTLIYAKKAEAKEKKLSNNQDQVQEIIPGYSSIYKSCLHTKEITHSKVCDYDFTPAFKKITNNKKEILHDINDKETICRVL